MPRVARLGPGTGAPAQQESPRHPTHGKSTRRRHSQGGPTCVPILIPFRSATHRSERPFQSKRPSLELPKPYTWGKVSFLQKGGSPLARSIAAGVEHGC